MRGNEKVIEQLNAALSSELTAIVQYMVQAEMCENWGYKRLGERTRSRAIEEMRHAEGLIERILFLDGTPGVNVGLVPKIGTNVQEMLQTDLADEKEAVVQYNKSAKVCVAANDEGTRELFERMIRDEETHVDYLEAQLHTIEEIGIGNYLSQQLYEGK
ncbi:MAG TPA: bacterioferritin [Terriglobales bacterium]|nr:bacterioferritin [Terriglobales bacterium]